MSRGRRPTKLQQLWREYERELADFPLDDVYVHTPTSPPFALGLITIEEKRRLAYAVLRGGEPVRWRVAPDAPDEQLRQLGEPSLAHLRHHLLKEAKAISRRIQAALQGKPA